jgi:micrococcal nuclease
MSVKIKYNTAKLSRVYVLVVHDGDGMRVATPKGEVEIRMFGVDAPELGQRYGHAAMRWLCCHARGREFDQRQMARDRYGRCVVDLVGLDGRRLSVRLLQAGMAWWYRRYARDDNELADAEKKARADRRGLWQDFDPIPPWDWRYRKRRDVGRLR